MKSVYLWRNLNTDRVNGLTLSPAEQSRVETLRTESLRRQFTSGRHFLRRVLAAHLGQPPDKIRFKTDELGKPQLADTPVHFSFSASSELQVCAVSDWCAVGIDVQHSISTDDVRLMARSTLAPEEYEEWRSLPHEIGQDSFVRAWTRKEAVGKAIGTGIANGPATIHVPIYPFPQGTGHFVRKDQHRLLVSDWSVAENANASLAILSPPSVLQGDYADEQAGNDQALHCPTDTSLCVRNFASTSG